MVASGGVTSSGPDSQGVAKLGYPPAVFGEEPGLQWYVQEAALGMHYVVALGSRRAGDSTLYAVAVTATMDDPDPLALAKRRVRAALDAGWDALRAPHAAWWAGFWSQSQVSAFPTQPSCGTTTWSATSTAPPRAAARRRCRCRACGPPTPASLPPWKGDYHNDLNTQMTYIAYQAAGHFDEGLSYLDFLWDRRPRFQRFAREFYGTGGLAAPGVMTLAGQPLAGWVQYSLSPTMRAWSAHLFYLHWRYTMDDAFLRERAYPWAREVGNCMLGLLKPDANGILVLPLSSSPEIFDNSHRAWLQPNSNYDLMSLRMLFLALREMADALGRRDEAARWSERRRSARAVSRARRRHADALRERGPAGEPPPSVEPHGPAPVQPDHRGGRAAATRATIARVARRVGREGHEGVVRLQLLLDVGPARARRRRRGGAAPSRRSTRRPSSCATGSTPTATRPKSGFSNFTYRPFTLEGNFLAMHAVHEMLLQSWSPTPGQRDTEVIRIFPATPARWHDASFDDLRAEGGYLVSARRENGVTTWFRITGQPRRHAARARQLRRPRADVEPAAASGRRARTTRWR